MVEMYGIPNCDTIRKARKWLGDHGIVFIEVGFYAQCYEGLLA